METCVGSIRGDEPLPLERHDAYRKVFGVMEIQALGCSEETVCANESRRRRKIVEETSECVYNILVCRIVHHVHSHFVISLIGLFVLP